MPCDSQSDFPLCPLSVNTEHFLCPVTGRSDSHICAHYACYVNIEHFSCPVTAKQKRFLQEGEESEAAEEAGEAAGEDVCSQMTTIRRLELCSQSP